MKAFELAHMLDCPSSPKSKREVVAAKIGKDAREALERAAMANCQTVTSLVEKVIVDYLKSKRYLNNS